MEIARQITFQIEYRDEVTEELWETPDDMDNYNQLVGRLLFTHSLIKGDLVRAIKIHKKIQEFDLKQMEGLDNLDNYDCYLDDDEVKGGEYHMRVCASLKREYDFREKALKWTINMLKNEDYKVLSKFILEVDDFYYEKHDDFEAIVDMWLDLDIEDGASYIFKRPRGPKGKKIEFSVLSKLLTTLNKI